MPIVAEYQPTHFPAQEALLYQYQHRSREDATMLNSELYKDLSMQELSKNAIDEYFEQTISKRLFRLDQTFEKKLQNHLAAFEGIELDLVQKAASFVSMWGLLTHPEKIGLDLTDDTSVFLSLVYTGEHRAYLEFFFEPGAEEPVQHNVNIYKNKKMVFAYSGQFIESLQAFFQHMPLSVPIEY